MKIKPLEGEDLKRYGIMRTRDVAFDAVCALWRQRQKEGWTYKKVAEKIDCDVSWVYNALNSPGNWLIETIGILTQALEGEIDIKVYALEDYPAETPSSPRYQTCIQAIRDNERNVLLEPVYKTEAIAKLVTEAMNVADQRVKEELKPFVDLANAFKATLDAQQVAYQHQLPEDDYK